MRDILQSRYLRSYVAHKQLARTSLEGFFLSLRKSGFRQFHSLAPKTESELSRILSLDLLTYKLPTSEKSSVI